MTKYAWAGLIIALLLVGGAAVFLVIGGGVAYETPNYEVVEEIGAVEIREYAPYLVAETAVEGDLENAGNIGFRILASYIFGDNQGERKIAMTAPVSQERGAGSKIAMTAPVTQERADDRFTIQFAMPSKYTLETLPKPNDPRIEIREVPARKFAAIRYSGTWSRKNYEKHLARLREALAANGYEAMGEPIWARYDPPFKPWFLRRNEILTAFR
ncbi:MAG: heme-binding protein [Myxococcales bacterium]|nr:heme-binding protein [Myxococcales bacterium]MDH3485384.1 heme-binding protein [Myxococcales bacterium]